MQCWFTGEKCLIYHTKDRLSGFLNAPVDWCKSCSILDLETILDRVGIDLVDLYESLQPDEYLEYSQQAIIYDNVEVVIEALELFKKKAKESDDEDKIHAFDQLEVLFKCLKMEKEKEEGK